MIPTRDLAIFASIVGLLNGVWVLYVGLVRDRARVCVKAAEGHVVSGRVSRPTVSVTVSNRGRRSVQISQVCWVSSARTGEFMISTDLVQQVPFSLGESEAKNLLHGYAGGYTKGSVPLRRRFVTDGAGRIHPLRERYRQRLEKAVFANSRRIRRRGRA